MAEDDLTGQHHCKEHRLRVRCSKCGRVLRSQQSQVRLLCCVCEADGNLNQVWARRIRLKDGALLQLMQQKIHLPDDKLLAFLKKEVELK